ncbi:unnamed protein product [Pleuronectes platessa]|uniref:Uncharacterized protein n=1 Tax=Pleuronectes platessa TaxID=8262 RepID=A0A9N7Z1S7_PLEPL|nr:unnamed protein product [Pleuronectes platessa]
MRQPAPSLSPHVRLIGLLFEARRRAGGKLTEAAPHSASPAAHPQSPPGVGGLAQCGVLGPSGTEQYLGNPEQQTREEKLDLHMWPSSPPGPFCGDWQKMDLLIIVPPRERFNEKRQQHSPGKLLRDQRVSAQVGAAWFAALQAQSHFQLSALSP